MATRAIPVRPNWNPNFSGHALSAHSLRNTSIPLPFCPRPPAPTATCRAMHSQARAFGTRFLRDRNAHLTERLGLAVPRRVLQHPQSHQLPHAERSRLYLRNVWDLAHSRRDHRHLHHVAPDSVRRQAAVLINRKPECTNTNGRCSMHRPFMSIVIACPPDSVSSPYCSSLALRGLKLVARLATPPALPARSPASPAQSRSAPSWRCRGNPSRRGTHQTAGDNGEPQSRQIARGPRLQSWPSKRWPWSMENAGMPARAREKWSER